MRTSLQDLTFRPPRLDDAQQTHQMIVRCAISEYGQPDSDLEDLLHDWGQMDLNHDAWLAFTPKGELIGYGAVLPGGPNLRYDFFVDPAWASEALGQALLARCEARGLALAQERGETAEMMAQVYVPHVNQQERKIVEQAGFQPVKYHFNMQIQMDSPPPASHWPEGVSLRAATPGQDDRQIHQFIQAAFHRPGRTPQPFEAWQASMMRSDIFDPDLWFLAFAEEEIVGACLCFAYSDEGWVRQLGVAETWRRRGLGTALLRHAFGEFKKRGYDKVGLGVAGDNTTAYAFYEKVGMKRLRQYDEYQKPLKPAG
jgi:mycothiol synthase